MQAPCTVTSQEQWKPFNTVTVDALAALNVFEVGGPTWYITKGKLSKFLSLDKLQAFLASGWGTALTNVAVKAFDHYA